MSVMCCLFKALPFSGRFVDAPILHGHRVYYFVLECFYCSNNGRELCL